jgi:hypothetical protein
MRKSLYMLTFFSWMISISQSWNDMAKYSQIVYECEECGWAVFNPLALDPNEPGGSDLIGWLSCSGGDLVSSPPCGVNGSKQCNKETELCRHIPAI